MIKHQSFDHEGGIIVPMSQILYSNFNKNMIKDQSFDHEGGIIVPIPII